MSKNVTLRLLEDADVPEVHRMTNDMAIIRHMMWTPHGEAETRSFVEESRSPDPKAPFQSRAWAVVCDGRLAGIGGLLTGPDKRTAEAWYLLDKPFWGKGIGTEAARRLLREGFETLSLHRIWATCLQENPASIRLLEKAGFRREGYQRKNLMIHGEWRDSWLFAILKEEWSG